MYEMRDMRAQSFELDVRYSELWSKEVRRSKLWLKEVIGFGWGYWLIVQEKYLTLTENIVSENIILFKKKYLTLTVNIYSADIFCSRTNIYIYHLTENIHFQEKLFNSSDSMKLWDERYESSKFRVRGEILRALVQRS